MYVIKCDDKTLYNPLRQELTLSAPTLNLEVNKVGSVTFSMYPTHPQYNALKKMESIISVLQDSRIIFKGRVYSDAVNFYKVKRVEVEGLLAYFNDSIVRPYNFSGGVREYLEFLITQHNDQVSEHQRFILGEVTVEDPNDYITRENTNNPTTWAEIEEKLVTLLGGYIIIRYEDDGNYIDYLADYTDTSTQKIEFTINLLDLESTVKGDALSTCIIPYGATIKETTDNEEGEDTELEENGETETVETETVETTGTESKRVDITSVNNGIDYVQNDEAVAKYGKIYEVVIWEDVTEPLNLLNKAREYLSHAIKLNNSLTIKAVDLHLADETIEAFKIGDHIRVYSKPHGIDETLLLTSYSLDITNPSGFTFSLGREVSTLLDSQISTDRTTSNNVNRIDTVDKKVDDLSTSTEKSVSETLNYVNQVLENSEEYTRTLLKEYVKTSDVETLNEQISLTYQQTAEEINLAFNTLSSRITEENGEIHNELNEISKYIRFVDGAIILGEAGTDLTTKIANGRISFLYNDTLEVAYISDNKLYITNAEILTEIIIGNFGFIPRRKADGTFGNLSFKKVR